MGKLNRWLLLVANITSVVALVSGISTLSALYIFQISGTAAISVGLELLEIAVLGLGFLVVLRQSRAGDKTGIQVAMMSIRLLWPLLALFAFVLVSTLISPNWEGAQTAITVSLLSLGILAFTFVPDSSNYARMAIRLLPLLGLGLSFLVFWGIAIPSLSVIPGDRPLGFALLIPLAVAVAMPPRTLLERISPYVIFAGIFLTESRTPSIIAFILIGLVVVRDVPQPHPRKAIFKAVLVYIGAGMFVGINFFFSQAQWARYSEEGDGGLTVPFVPASSPLPASSTQLPSLIPPGAAQGGLVLNTNGRTAVWEWLLGMPKNLDWVWGKGSGFASEMLQETKRGVFDYPHNEYIRFLVDFGFIGLVLLVSGFCMLCIFLWRRNGQLPRSPLANAALLIIFALLAASATDNPLLRVYLLGPAALVIGLAIRERANELGRFAPKRNKAKDSRIRRASTAASQNVTKSS